MGRARESDQHATLKVEIQSFQHVVWKPHPSRYPGGRARDRIFSVPLPPSEPEPDQNRAGCDDQDDRRDRIRPLVTESGAVKRE